VKQRSGAFSKMGGVLSPGTPQACDKAAAVPHNPEATARHMQATSLWCCCGYWPLG
jgi:hypothetical protein